MEKWMVFFQEGLVLHLGGGGFFVDKWGLACCQRGTKYRKHPRGV